jgi:hypothetical protein
LKLILTLAVQFVWELLEGKSSKWEKFGAIGTVGMVCLFVGSYPQHQGRGPRKSRHRIIGLQRQPRAVAHSQSPETIVPQIRHSGKTPMEPLLPYLTFAYPGLLCYHNGDLRSQEGRTGYTATRTGARFIPRRPSVGQGACGCGMGHVLRYPKERSFP